jgi:hypothetical protein
LGSTISSQPGRPTSGIARRRRGGLFTRQKGGFYHGGRFPDLRAVVDHYNSTFSLNLTEGQKRELIEYLKSL